MSSSDTSDDEEMQKIKEATDAQLLNDGMFINKDRQGSVDIKTAKALAAVDTLKSQRYIDLEDDHCNDIKVPEATQKHISKKLSDIITKRIKFVTNVEANKLPTDEDLCDGIKLLRESKYPLEVEDIILKENPIKKRKIQKFNHKLNIENCEKVAISGDDILFKNDTKHWSNRSKSEIYCYKKDKHRSTCSLIQNK